MSRESITLERGSPVDEKSLEDTEKPQEVTYPEGGARAWAVAIGASAAIFSTFGFANSFGVFQEYYETHQLKDKDPSTIAWIGSVQLFILFASGLVAGPLFDRYGAKIFPPAAMLYVFAVMMTSICKAYWQFMLAQGVLTGLAMGCTLAPCLGAVSHYFHKNRGGAIGLAVGGSSLGGVIFPIALSRMLYNSNLSFGWSVRICGFIMVALLLPSTLAIRARLPPRKGKFLLPAAFKELPYTTLVGGVFLMILAAFSPLFYLPTYAIKHGMSPTLASYLVSILNGASFFGRVIPGITADKIGPLNMLSLAGVCTGILLLCWQKCESNASIIAFAALFGFCSGAVISLNSVCLSRIPKDPRNIGTYMGMGMACVGIAALIGPPIDGALVSRYNSFNQVAIFSGIFCIVGGLMILVSKYTTGKSMLSKN